jgi:hypothetical protein
MTFSQIGSDSSIPRIGSKTSFMPVNFSSRNLDQEEGGHRPLDDHRARLEARDVLRCFPGSSY